MRTGSEPVEETIETADGWRLAAYRYRHRVAKKAPVLLLHGLGTNRFDVDFSIPRLSLARYLHRRGFEAWVVELRGAGKSRRAGRLAACRDRYFPDWILDDYIFDDIPAIVSFIRRKTGRRKFHWVGHSLGGTLVYAALAAHGDGSCASAAVLGAGMSASARPSFVKVLLRLDPLMKLVPVIPMGTLGRLAAPLARWLAPLEENTFYSGENVDREILEEAMKKATENISMPLFLQLHSWYKENHFRARNGVSYRDGLKKIRAPFLVGAGSVDGVTPYPDVHFGFRKIGSRRKKMVVFGRASGCRHEYGHIDLVLGRHAPEEVFPVVADWLEAHDS